MHLGIYSEAWRGTSLPKLVEYPNPSARTSHTGSLTFSQVFKVHWGISWPKSKASISPSSASCCYHQTLSAVPFVGGVNHPLTAAQKHQKFVPRPTGKGTRQEVLCFGLARVACSTLHRHWLFCASFPWLFVDSGVSFAVQVLMALSPTLCKFTLYSSSGEANALFLQKAAWAGKFRSHTDLFQFGNVHIWDLIKGHFLLLAALGCTHTGLALSSPAWEAEQLSGGFCVDTGAAAIGLSCWGLGGIAGDVGWCMKDLQDVGSYASCISLSCLLTHVQAQ